MVINSSLDRKPFLDYNGQIQQLKSKNLMIPDEPYAKYILEKVSYYNLINGYKDVFKNPSSNNYLNDTTFDDIYNLYQMDACLRNVFLKYFLIVEKHIKSSISYHFTSLYGNGRFAYQNTANYDFGNHSKDIQKLFHKIDNKICGQYVSPQIAHYYKTYQDVPLWVLNTDLTFGETATMFRYLKGSCKTRICNDFNKIGKSDLSKMLILLTKFRNVCAHGNRLFSYHTQDALLDNIVHKNLDIPLDNNLYRYGKSDLFAAVIALKFLLSNEDFHLFYRDLKKLLKQYEPSEKILFMMGLPDNWSSIIDIEI
jgi:abortive infection bacteriophage resistance protein